MTGNYFVSTHQPLPPRAVPSVSLALGLMYTRLVGGDPKYVLRPALVVVQAIAFVLQDTSQHSTTHANTRAFSRILRLNVVFVEAVNTRGRPRRVNLRAANRLVWNNHHVPSLPGYEQTA